MLLLDCALIAQLERAGLVDPLFRLPLRFAAIGHLVLRSLAGEPGQKLIRRGLEVAELTPDEMRRAAVLLRSRSDISVCAALGVTLATSRNWPMLVGEHCHLRLADEQKARANNILWVVDQLESAGLLTPTQLAECLRAIETHPRCHLPATELRRRRSRYSAR